MAVKPSNTPQNTPVPDPTDIYERSRPRHESGAGRLDNNNDAVPEDRADEMPKAVHNRQNPTHQINGDDEDRKV